VARRPASASSPSRWRSFLVRHTERVELAGYVFYDPVDLSVGTVAGVVHRPSGKDVTEGIELSCDAQQRDDLRDIGRRGRVALECVPEILAVTSDRRGVLPERRFGAAHEVEEVVDALRLRLCIANQRGAQTPFVCARALREVDQTGECWWFDIGGHGPQATEPLSSRRRTRRRDHSDVLISNESWRSTPTT
jgi:hypothetical protein